MRCLRHLLAPVLLASLVACGGDDHEEHEFETYLECWEHQEEEGLTDIGATTECDAFFEITHDDNADCLADHTAEVTAGVPQTAIDAHCDSEFPPA